MLDIALIRHGVPGMVQLICRASTISDTRKWALVLVPLLLLIIRWLILSVSRRKAPVQRLWTVINHQSVVGGQHAAITRDLVMPTAFLMTYEKQQNCSNRSSSCTNKVSGFAKHVAGLVQVARQRNPQEHRNRFGAFDKSPSLGEMFRSNSLQRQHFQRIPKAADA